MTDRKYQDPPTEVVIVPSRMGAPPSVKAKGFACPHCGMQSHQDWYTLHANLMDKDSLPFIAREGGLENAIGAHEPDKVIEAKWKKLTERYGTGNVFFQERDSTYSKAEVQNLHLSKCYTCNEFAVWVHERLVHPPLRTGPAPNEDFPKAVRTDYEEARSILTLSPRGAAALLRLCVEKLCIHLNAQGSTLNAMIADLVGKGLDVRVQRALDAVRVTGSEAVHPGRMDLKDDTDTAETLFRLVNVISEKMISEPKHIERAYEKLPESKRKQIERRDKKSDWGPPPLDAAIEEELTAYMAKRKAANAAA